MNVKLPLMMTTVVFYIVSSASPMLAHNYSRNQRSINTENVFYEPGTHISNKFKNIAKNKQVMTPESMIKLIINPDTKETSLTDLSKNTNQRVAKAAAMALALIKAGRADNGLYPEIKTRTANIVKLFDKANYGASNERVSAKNKLFGIVYDEGTKYNTLKALVNCNIARIARGARIISTLMDDGATRNDAARIAKLVDSYENSSAEDRRYIVNRLATIITDNNTSRNAINLINTNCNNNYIKSLVSNILKLEKSGFSSDDAKHAALLMFKADTGNADEKNVASNKMVDDVITAGSLSNAAILEISASANRRIREAAKKVLALRSAGFDKISAANVTRLAFSNNETIRSAAATALICDVVANQETDESTLRAFATKKYSGQNGESHQVETAAQSVLDLRQAGLGNREAGDMALIVHSTDERVRQRIAENVIEGILGTPQTPGTTIEQIAAFHADDGNTQYRRVVEAARRIMNLKSTGLSAEYASAIVVIEYSVNKNSRELAAAHIVNGIVTNKNITTETLNSISAIASQSDCPAFAGVSSAIGRIFELTSMGIGLEAAIGITGIGKGLTWEIREASADNLVQNVVMNKNTSPETLRAVRKVLIDGITGKQGTRVVEAIRIVLRLRNLGIGTDQALYMANLVYLSRNGSAPEIKQRAADELIEKVIISGDTTDKTLETMITVSNGAVQAAANEVIALHKEYGSASIGGDVAVVKYSNNQPARQAAASRIMKSIVDSGIQDNLLNALKAAGTGNPEACMISLNAARVSDLRRLGMSKNMAAQLATWLHDAENGPDGQRQPAINALVEYLPRKYSNKSLMRMIRNTSSCEIIASAAGDIITLNSKGLGKSAVDFINIKYGSDQGSRLVSAGSFINAVVTSINTSDEALSSLAKMLGSGHLPAECEPVSLSINRVTELRISGLDNAISAGVAGLLFIAENDADQNARATAGQKLIDDTICSLNVSGKILDICSASSMDRVSAAASRVAGLIASGIDRETSINICRLEYCYDQEVQKLASDWLIRNTVAHQNASINVLKAITGISGENEGDQSSRAALAAQRALDIYGQSFMADFVALMDKAENDRDAAARHGAETNLIVNYLGNANVSEKVLGMICNSGNGALVSAGNKVMLLRNASGNSMASHLIRLEYGDSAARQMAAAGLIENIIGSDDAPVSALTAIIANAGGLDEESKRVINAAQKVIDLTNSKLFDRNEAASIAALKYGYTMEARNTAAREIIDGRVINEDISLAALKRIITECDASNNESACVRNAAARVKSLRAEGISKRDAADITALEYSENRLIRQKAADELITGTICNSAVEDGTLNTLCSILNGNKSGEAAGVVRAATNIKLLRSSGLDDIAASGINVLQYSQDPAKRAVALTKLMNIITNMDNSPAQLKLIGKVLKNETSREGIRLSFSISRALSLRKISGITSRDTRNIITWMDAAEYGSEEEKQAAVERLFGVSTNKGTDIKVLAVIKTSGNSAVSSVAGYVSGLCAARLTRTEAINVAILLRNAEYGRTDEIRNAAAESIIMDYVFAQDKRSGETILSVIGEINDASPAGRNIKVQINNVLKIRAQGIDRKAASNIAILGYSANNSVCQDAIRNLIMSFTDKNISLIQKVVLGFKQGDTKQRLTNAAYNFSKVRNLGASAANSAKLAACFDGIDNIPYENIYERCDNARELAKIINNLNIPGLTGYCYGIINARCSAISNKVQDKYGVRIGGLKSLEYIIAADWVLGHYPVNLITGLKSISVNDSAVNGRDGIYFYDCSIYIRSNMHDYLLFEILVHETGHFIDDRKIADGQYRLAFFNDLYNKSYKIDRRDFCRAYGKVNCAEDFATTCEDFFLNTQTAFIKAIGRGLNDGMDKKFNANLDDISLSAFISFDLAQLKNKVGSAYSDIYNIFRKNGVDLNARSSANMSKLINAFNACVDKSDFYTMLSPQALNSLGLDATCNGIMKELAAGKKVDTSSIYRLNRAIITKMFPSVLSGSVHHKTTVYLSKLMKLLDYMSTSGGNASTVRIFVHADAARKITAPVTLKLTRNASGQINTINDINVYNKNGSYNLEELQALFLNIDNR